MLSTQPPPVVADGVLPELRTATRQHHDEIERLLALDAPMPLARYGVILQGFQRFLSSWEAELRGALPARLHGWLADRTRLGFIEDDLAALGLMPVAGIAVPPCLPEHSVAAAFGALYVIEGSALGGQVITPRLQRDMGLTPGHGASYFRGFGDRTGSMWREFRQRAATEIGDSHADHRVACRSAQQTFSALIATFRPLLS